MRIDVARQPLSLVLAVCIILLALFSVRFSVAPSSAEMISEGMPLGSWINGLGGDMPFFRCLASVLIILFSGVYITRIISAKLVLPARNYLPSIFYIMISCGILYPCGDLASVLASYLAIKASANFIGSFKRAHNFGRIFVGALMLGIASLLSSPFIVLIVLVPIAMGIFRRSGREVVVALVGMVLPLFAYAYVTWFNGGSFSDIFATIHNAFLDAEGMTVGPETFSILRTVVLGLFGLLILLSLAYFRSASSDMRTTAYKVFVYMMFFLILAVLAMVIFGINAATLLLIAMPASFLIPLFFTKNRSLFATTVYLLTIGAVIALNLAKLA